MAALVTTAFSSTSVRYLSYHAVSSGRIEIRLTSAGTGLIMQLLGAFIEVEWWLAERHYNSTPAITRMARPGIG
jgi:hypothetical protein